MKWRGREGEGGRVRQENSDGDDRRVPQETTNRKSDRQASKKQGVTYWLAGMLDREEAWR